MDWVLLVTGYDEAAVGKLAESILSTHSLEKRGSINLVSNLYRIGHSLSSQEAAMS